MTLYVDSSALLTVYLNEPKREAAAEILSTDSSWLAARHTQVEVRRNLVKVLNGRALATARRRFRRDWDQTNIVELGPHVCDLAAQIAESTGVRTLDALHLAAVRASGEPPIVTYDRRQAAAARTLGLTVLGAE